MSHKADNYDALPDDWSDEQNALFVKVHRFIVANKDAMCHPGCPIVSPEHWQTVAHNAAFVAAELSEADSVRIIDMETEETIAESPGKLNS